VSGKRPGVKMFRGLVWGGIFLVGDLSGEKAEIISAGEGVSWGVSREFVRGKSGAWLTVTRTHTHIHPFSRAKNRSTVLYNFRLSTTVDGE